MWHDAGFTYIYSQEPIIFLLDSNDVHPPLYYLFVKLWLKVSHDELWIRLSSFIFFIPFCYYFYGLMRHKLSSTTSCLMTLAMAVSPTIIYYSLEPRNYMMGMLLVAMQVYYFYQAPTKRNLAIVTLLSIMMLYTHYFTAFVLLAEAIILFLDNADLQKYKASLFAICLSAIPLSVYAIKSLLKSESFWFDAITPLSFISSIAYQYTLPKMMGSLSAMFYVGLFLMVIAAILFLLFSDHDYEPIIFFFMPTAIVWGISQFHPLYHHRFFLFYGFGLYWLIGILLNAAIQKNKLGTMLFLSVVIIIPSIYAVWHFTDNQSHELSRSQAVVKEYLKENPMPILHETTFSQTPYKYYFRDTATINYLRTNLTEKQRFTAGGSVIKESELNPLLNEYILISSKILDEEVIYHGEGLYAYHIFKD